MLGNFGVTEENWREALDGSVQGYPPAPEGFENSESPRYVGRAVTALCHGLSASTVESALGDLSRSRS